MTEDRLKEIEKKLEWISPFPWKCIKTVGGEYWITAPDDSEHDYREEYEPIYESSGTTAQLGIDGKFIAESPEIIQALIHEIRSSMNDTQL